MDLSSLKPIVAMAVILLVSFAAAEDSGIRRTKWPIGEDMDVEAGPGLVLNVKTLAAKGDGKADDTPAFAAALDMLGESGGTLVVPPGRYLVGDLKFGSNITIKGAGVPRPVLIKTASASTILDLTGEVVSGRRKGIHDVTIESLTLRGRSVEDGFKEHVHNVNAMGVSRLLIHDVVFEAFQGDGLYLGSRFSEAEPVVHNAEVIVADSEFRGVNSQNRNGISVIDCNHCIFEHNTFSDLTRPDMPGPIDIEPNQLDEIVRNIVVRNNTISGTNGAGLSVALRAGEFKQPPGHIVIENNRIENAKIGIRILRGSASITRSMDIVVRRNLVRGTDRPLWIDGIFGITVDHNEFSDSPGTVQIGCNFAAGIRFTGNRIQHVGSQTGKGVFLCGTLSLLHFRSNTFIDMGSSGQNGSAVYFSSGLMESVAFFKNVFSSPHHLTHTAIRSAVSAKIRDGRVVWTGNILKDDITLGTLP